MVLSVLFTILKGFLWKRALFVAYEEEMFLEDIKPRLYINKV